MTIAVSVTVRPSRLLFLMVSAMSLAATAAGFAIGLGHIGELSILYRGTLAAFILFTAVFGFYHGIRHRKPIHIDISGVGQIRLTEVCAAGACTNTKRPHVRGSTGVVRLAGDSTIWPHLLLLRLLSESGKISTLPVLPDSVSRDDFRALSVACRWIAAHNDSAGREDFLNSFERN